MQALQGVMQKSGGRSDRANMAPKMDDEKVYDTHTYIYIYRYYMDIDIWI